MKEYSIIITFGKEKNKEKQVFTEYEIREAVEGFKEGMKEGELAIRIGSNKEAVTKLINKLKLMKIINSDSPLKKITKSRKKIKRIKKKK